MVIEAGVVAGYLIAWVVRKARRVTGRVDVEFDAAVDATLDKLLAAVAAKIGGHPALDELRQEAAEDSGQVSELTRQQLELAITAVARKDETFAHAVTALVDELRQAEQASGVSVVAGADSTVFTGDAHVQASSGGIAFGQVGGDVHVNRDHGGESRPDPSPPGRSSH